MQRLTFNRDTIVNDFKSINNNTFSKYFYPIAAEVFFSMARVSCINNFSHLPVCSVAYFTEVLSQQVKIVIT